MNRLIRASLRMTAAAIAIAVFGLTGFAQDRGQEGCRGCMRMGQSQGPQDMQTIHALFNEHKKIRRTVKNIENGVETLTESDDQAVQAMIVEHALAMQKRLENKQPIRQWDPLFAELFKHAEKITMQISKTQRGVRVVETSSDAYVVKLMQSHAQGVSEFVAEGMSSMHKSHELPGSKADEKSFLGKGDGLTTCPVTGAPVDKSIKAEILGRTVYFCCQACRDAAQKNPELYLKP